MISHKLPQLESVSLEGKTALVRVDFNVPVENGKITDDFRIQKTRPLLEDLRRRGARMLLLSHLTEKKEHRSFKPLLSELQKKCGMKIDFALTIAEAREKLKAEKTEAVLLENLRVFSGEERNDLNFARELASLGDVFINESFSQSHRPNASVVRLPKLLPSYVGPVFAEEVKKLGEAFHPKHPFVFILGGVKFRTKVTVLDHMLEKADSVFIGGAIANTFLYAAGYEVGKSPVERDAASSIRKKFLKHAKLILPVDVRVHEKKVRKVSEIESKDYLCDIGPETVDLLKQELKGAATVLWNGPLGFVEKGYDDSTLELIRMLSRMKAHIIIGGGDTAAIIRKKKLERKFYHLSTGGGAMLEFLAKGTLPGIQAIASS